jgi:hypothetical protein
MDLIHQVMGQKIVPEGAAAGDQNIFTRLAFEFGDLLVRVAPSNNAQTLPVTLQRIGDDHALDGFSRLGKLAF